MVYGGVCLVGFYEYDIRSLCTAYVSRAAVDPFCVGP